jgi:hypothetical protein
MTDFHAIELPTLGNYAYLARITNHHKIRARFDGQTTVNYPDHLLNTLAFYRRLLNSDAPLAARAEIVALLEELEATAAKKADVSAAAVS